MNYIVLEWVHLKQHLTVKKKAKNLIVFLQIHLQYKNPHGTKFIKKMKSPTDLHTDVLLLTC